MSDPRNPKTKAEAVAFVAAILRSAGLVLLSPDFQIAMDLSRRFDISVADVLEYRRRAALHT